MVSEITQAQNRSSYEDALICDGQLLQKVWSIFESCGEIDDCGWFEDRDGWSKLLDSEKEEFTSENIEGHENLLFLNFAPLLYRHDKQEVPELIEKLAEEGTITIPEHLDLDEFLSEINGYDLALVGAPEAWIAVSKTTHQIEFIKVIEKVNVKEEELFRVEEVIKP